MRSSCAILLNNKAGAFGASTSLDQIHEMTKALGLRAELLTPASPEELSLLTRQLVAAGVERIAVAGGDGTVSLAVQELANTSSVLGILPLGTANNFATALRLPHDLPSALRVLREGEIIEVTLGKLNGHYFTEAAGVGLFADALARYGQDANKNVFRGIYALMRVLLPLRARNLRLLLDGKPHTERALMCTVANTYRMAHAVPIAPGAKLTDDTLNVVVIGDLRPTELIPYYRAVRAQAHLGLPKVTTLEAREVRIEARQRVNVHCDDHIVGTTPVTISLAPKALRVLVEPLASQG